jgi:hypothetical protein
MLSDVRLVVFTALTMKNGVFLDVKPCGCCKVLQEPHGVTSQKTPFFNAIGNCGQSFSEGQRRSQKISDYITSKPKINYRNSQRCNKGAKCSKMKSD